MKMPTSYSPHSFAKIIVHAGRRITKIFEHNFQTFERCGECRFTIQISEVSAVNLNNIDMSLGSEHKVSFHRYGNTFIYSDAGEQVHLHSIEFIDGKVSIGCTSGINEAFLILLVEYFIRLVAVNNRVALVHAGGMSNGEQGEIYLGWAGAGKTLFIIDGIAEGKEFLAEDRLWLGNQKIYSYPRYFRINHSNAHALFRFLSRRGKLKFLLTKVFLKVVSKYRYRNTLIKSLFKLIYVSEKVDCSKILPPSRVKKEANLSSLVFLEKSSLMRKPVSPDIIENIFFHISFYEWNGKLLELASAFDVLFRSEKSFRSKIEILMRDELEIFRENLTGVKISYQPQPFRQSLQLTKNIT